MGNISSASIWWASGQERRTDLAAEISTAAPRGVGGHSSARRTPLPRRLHCSLLCCGGAQILAPSTTLSLSLPSSAQYINTDPNPFTHNRRGLPSRQGPAAPSSAQPRQRQSPAGRARVTVTRIAHALAIPAGARQPAGPVARAEWGGGGRGCLA